MSIVWKDIDGYNGYYQVSNDGRVRSFHKQSAGKELKLSVTKYGYHRLELSLNGNAKKHAVHRLVAIAFIPNIKKSPEINHINGNKLDNRVENLEWCTSRENQVHAFKIGLQKSRPGEEHHNSKLTKEQVIEIRTLYETGNYKQVELAKKYGVHAQYVNLIVKRRRWKHV